MRAARPWRTGHRSFPRSGLSGRRCRRRSWTAGCPRANARSRVPAHRCPSRRRAAAERGRAPSRRAARGATGAAWRRDTAAAAVAAVVAARGARSGGCPEVRRPCGGTRRPTARASVRLPGSRGRGQHDLRRQVLGGPTGPGPGRDIRSRLHGHTAGQRRDGHADQQAHGDSGSLHLITLRRGRGSGEPVGPDWPAWVTPISAAPTAVPAFRSAVRRSRCAVPPRSGRNG